jgi:16S rRNA (guanine527-N7)-methyltransferase
MEDILIKYFPHLPENQIDKYKELLKIFPSWNEKVNLISRKDIQNLFINHILHSLSIGKIIDFSPKTNIVDVGTGGGFPGIPLAIMFPKSNFDLVDSIGKKINIVSEIATHLNLNNVKGIKSRAELLPPKYDFVISRAVTTFPEFMRISGNLLRKRTDNVQQGYIYLKGGDFEKELSGFKNIKTFKISDFFEQDFFETKKIIFLDKKSNQSFCIKK